MTSPKEKQFSARHHERTHGWSSRSRKKSAATRVLEGRKKMLGDEGNS